MGAPKTWEQPRQPVLSRWREGDVTWAELACGHIEPATGKDLWMSVPCQQCDPVMKPLSALRPAGAG